MAAGATVWLDDLPAIVASLERDWAITAGQTLSGGTDSYVAEVTRADGSPAVLKVIFPRDVPSARNEMACCAPRLACSRRAGCCWPRPTRWPGKPLAGMA